MKPENVRFFNSAADFREWLEQNHDKVPFQWIGFWKKASGKTGMSYDEAVLEALCFGWIDGQTNRVDDDAVTTRFSPRRPGSNWSQLKQRSPRSPESVVLRAGQMEELIAFLKTF